MNMAVRANVSERSFSERLIELLLHVPAGDIPAAAIDAALLCMEDTIGVAIAAWALDVGPEGAKVALEGGGGGSLVWGTGRSASSADAAMANGMLSHALDFDDTHPAAIMHASAVNVPVALALGDEVGASPSEILAALVLGYEVSARLGRLGPGPFQDHGFQSTAVLGIFASVFISARLLGVSPTVAVQAMGVAGSMASGLMEYLSDGSHVKQLHPGWAAQAGIRAVKLARAGLTGPRTVLEGRFGVFRSYAALTIDPQDVLGPLGPRFEVEEMAPKPYPACLCVHPMVQAVLELRRTGAVTEIDAVESIHCEVPAWYVNLVFEPFAEKQAPRNAYEGRFSAPYCMGRALMDGGLGVGSFGEDKLSDPRLLGLMARVTYEARPFPEFPASFPAQVRVRLRDGTEHERFVPHNLGSRGCPLGREGVEAKFRDCTEFAVGADAARRLGGVIRGFGEADSADALWAALKNARAR